MTSAGGLAPLGQGTSLPVSLLLSGPAGGVLAAADAAAAAGFLDVVTFDMGGTSTDVCLVRGGIPEPAGERHVAGFPVRMPSLDVHTIGAGGGSIASIDSGGALQVGPRSAGARPGPACYGHGGVEPTVTDANLVAGRLDRSAELPGIGLPRRRGGRGRARSSRRDGRRRDRGGRCRDGGGRSFGVGGSGCRSGRAGPRCVRGCGSAPRLCDRRGARHGGGGRAGSCRRLVGTGLPDGTASRSTWSAVGSVRPMIRG